MARNDYGDTLNKPWCPATYGMLHRTLGLLKSEFEDSSYCNKVHDVLVSISISISIRL